MKISEHLGKTKKVLRMIDFLQLTRLGKFYGQVNRFLGFLALQAIQEYINFTEKKFYNIEVHKHRILY